MAIITNLQPPAGTPVAADQPLSVDVIDPVIEELRVFMWVVLEATGAVELVHDGTGFTALYSFSTITPIAGGRQFSILRVGGWPSQPSLRVDTCACSPEVVSTGSADVLVRINVDAAATAVFIGLEGANIALSTLSTPQVNWLADADYTLSEVVLQSVESNYGTTIIGAIVNPAFNLSAGATMDATDSQTFNTASGVVTWDFSLDVDQGDRLAISFDGQFSGGDFVGYARLVPR